MAQTLVLTEMGNGANQLPPSSPFAFAAFVRWQERLRSFCAVAGAPLVRQRWLTDRGYAHEGGRATRVSSSASLSPLQSSHELSTGNSGRLQSVGKAKDRDGPARS